MFELSFLPTLNATLNATSAVLLVAGYLSIRQGRKSAHKICMVGALTLSIAFLVSYLYYHQQVGSVRFQGTGAVRTFYLGILLTHSVLAAAVPFLAAITVLRALREKFDKHRRLGRLTLPIWLYVSVTGVVVYWMLYRM